MLEGSYPKPDELMFDDNGEEEPDPDATGEFPITEVAQAIAANTIATEMHNKIEACAEKGAALVIFESSTIGHLSEIAPDNMKVIVEKFSTSPLPFVLIDFSGVKNLEEGRWEDSTAILVTALRKAGDARKNVVLFSLNPELCTKLTTLHLNRLPFCHFCDTYEKALALITTLSTAQ